MRLSETILIAIDPGRVAGWALFAPELVGCGVSDGAHAAASLCGRVIDRAVIERPHAGDSKASKDDVIVLSLRAGEWGGHVRALCGVEPEYITPNQWKGSLDKDVAARRVWALLTPTEQALVSNAVRGGPSNIVLVGGPKPSNTKPSNTVLVNGSTHNIVLVNRPKPIAQSKQHNMMDAVGVGLWALGRGIASR